MRCDSFCTASCGGFSDCPQTDWQFQTVSFWSTMYLFWGLLGLAHCVIDSWCSINICWKKSWMIPAFFTVYAIESEGTVSLNSPLSNPSQTVFRSRLWRYLDMSHFISKAAHVTVLLENAWQSPIIRKRGLSRMLITATWAPGSWIKWILLLPPPSMKFTAGIRRCTVWNNNTGFLLRGFEKLKGLSMLNKDPEISFEHLSYSVTSLLESSEGPRTWK